MTAYLCRACDTLHGWSRHPAVWPVSRHQRGTSEDIWYCPACGQEHRTHDGTMHGQVVKRWEAVPDVAGWLWHRERAFRVRFLR